jgi:hypothetical protein
MEKATPIPPARQQIAVKLRPLWTVSKIPISIKAKDRMESATILAVRGFSRIDSQILRAKEVAVRAM